MKNDMTLEIEPLSLAGVTLVKPKKHADSRGYFVETYNKKTFDAAGLVFDFVQDNQSLSTRRGTIRGIHLQRAPEPQAKLVRALSGAIFDVAVDLRHGSPTYGQWCGATLTASGGEQLLIPVGFGHAFCTLEDDTLVAYKVDGFYNKAAEMGLRWDDPTIAIDWPVAADAIHVSDKDAVLPFLRDLAAPIEFSPIAF